MVGVGLLLAALAVAVVPVETSDSHCGQVLWNAHWSGPCEGIRRQATLVAVLGCAGLAVVVAASRRRLLAVLLCGALLGAVATVNRLAEASEDPTYCGSLLNRVVYELDPPMDDACDAQLAGRRRQTAVAGAATVGLLAWAAIVWRSEARPRPAPRTDG